MIFREETMNLFDVHDSYCLAHCIASDLKMGKGIAVPINRAYKLMEQILKSGLSTKHPTCILTGRVFNLITKARSHHKPLAGDLFLALEDMKKIIVEREIKKIAMPRIGCGLDKLSWDDVKKFLQTTFSDLDVEILVCVLPNGWGG